VAAIGFSIPI